nr:nucleotidyl transferase AbiEii/AbiGii toxin family protein [uncultured Rhodopila sp.]
MSKTNRRFDRDTWRTLIGPALRVVDSLRHNGYGELDFHLGGGTVLMFRFDHRISKDLDIFTHDAQALSFISPRLNEVAAQEAVDYEEQANAVKLVLRDGDFHRGCARHSDGCMRSDQRWRKADRPGCDVGDSRQEAALPGG